VIAYFQPFVGSVFYELCFTKDANFQQIADKVGFSLDITALNALHRACRLRHRVI